MSVGRVGRVFRGIAIAVALLLLIAVIYVFTLGPSHASNLRITTATDGEAVAVASADTDLPPIDVTPGDQWHVQPLVTDLDVPLLNALPNPLLPRDPRVMLGRHEGLLITSPDASLEVRARLLADAADPDEPGFADADARLRDALPGTLSEERPPISVETLASEALLHHFTIDQKFTGIVALGDTLVEVRAETTDPDHDFDEYRPALSTLIESIAQAG